VVPYPEDHRVATGPRCAQRVRVYPQSSATVSARPWVTRKPASIARWRRHP